MYVNNEPTELQAILSSHTIKLAKGVENGTYSINLALPKVQNVTSVGKEIILPGFAVHRL